MYEIKVTGTFSGAHNLKDYKGKCERLHGHNWKVEVSASRKALDKSGMVLDFKDLKSGLKDILAGLDHAYLNEVPYFTTSNPTSENIARFVFDSLSKKISCVTKVTVWETDFSCASYYGEK